MSDNIKVVVKVRPLIPREIEEKLSYQWRIHKNTLIQLDQNGKDLGQSFTFDKVYDKDTKTSDVYDDVAKPIVQAATAGFNGTIFAYGQTSSGKTYTMTGTDNSPGIIPLAVINLFEIIKNIPDRDFLVRVSYIEIYNETVRDLLKAGKDNIKIHDTLHGVSVEVEEKVTSSPEEVLDAMREGEANREKGATNMNEESSRSHSIFQITIESREHIEGETEGGCVNVSQLNLVDLAGSERAGQTGATGIRFKEGTHINKSLSALALVIKQLSEDMKYVNYRDSKLTRILQNSLGGNAKTSIICAVTPAAVEETLSTLKFANRAKAIKNKPEVNAVATDATMIQRLTKQMSLLQAQLEMKKMLEQDNQNLQKQISSLQKFILNGFGQRPSHDVIGGAKRKLVQPRRVTIHSTLSSGDDEPVLVMPKFRTPCLKYNPLVLGAPAQLAAGGALPSVPEEPPAPPERPATPPRSRAVCFSGEVIELDSDDDSVRDDHETCSPIHKCYGSSKTPPCVLRKNARRAEKDLKEIVELTEREKIYAPSTVELLEKLEENTATINMLKDEINQLTEESKEKDKKLDVLNTKIKQSESELEAIQSSKMELKMQCDNYNTKLTDWEVSYETLKNKAKLREAELLSFLDEVNIKKPTGIGPFPSKTSENEINVLDNRSDDISNAKNAIENNVVHSGDSSATIDIVVTNPQEQINAKNQYIMELETNVIAHKQTIESLQNLTKELEQSITAFKEKIANVESENSLLNSTINSLNVTINQQKEDLDLANNDRESYNSLIQELQIKIKQRDDMLKANIEDNALEAMIANEKQFLANNENMMNFIHSFRLILASRNKEISKLNKKCKESSELISNNKNLMDQLQNKTEELDRSNLEVDVLMKQLNEHIALISKLMHEQTNHKVIEEELSSLQTKYIDLQKEAHIKETCIENLKSVNDILKINLTDKNKEIEEFNNKYTNLETIITQKDILINTLNKYKLESEENVSQAKTAVFKTQAILATLSGNMQEVPEVIDNFVHIFTVLCDSLNMLQTVASSVVNEKETLNNIQNSYEIEKQNLIQRISCLNNDLEMLKKELKITASAKDELEAKLNLTIGLRDNDVTANETKQKEFEQTLLAKDNEICHLAQLLEEINGKLKEQDSEIVAFKEQLCQVQNENNYLLTNIYDKIMEISKKIVIDVPLEEKPLNDSTTYEKINFTLDKIGNHIISIHLKNCVGDSNKIDEALIAAQKEITELTNENRNLTEKISNVFKQNSELLVKIETNDENNKRLSADLTISQHILKDLKDELKCKASEMLEMEEQLKQWKEHFEGLDIIMKKQMQDMKIENENLKVRIQQLNLKNETSVVSSDCNHKDDTCSNITPSKLSDSIPNLDINSPPSLLTICCNRIIDFLEPKENETKINENLDIDIDNGQSQLNNCKCTQLTLELIAAREENTRILNLLTEMKVINQGLLAEQDVCRHEIKILSELTQELQKKIVSHKTSLSILTATTYTENKLLQSQVKMLQHHLKRFHNICQKDITDLKTQLSSLMILLKTDANIYEEQNISVKRYSLPDVLDSSTVLPNLKNESTLDGDLLMLDTNVTLTTASNNTLIGQDQTSMDITQYLTEGPYQVNDINNLQQQFFTPEYNVFTEQIITLKEECSRLRELVHTHSEVKQFEVSAHNSPLNNDNSYCTDENKTNECVDCKELMILKDSHDKLTRELQRFSEELQIITTQKLELEQKYNNLILETPSTDALLKKLSIYEKEYRTQKDEIAKLNDVISNKNKDLKILQEENDTLSNQVMDNISEADSLIKEVDSLKQHNNELAGKLKETINTSSDAKICSQCKLKQEFTNEIMQTKAANTHTKLNRSLSDSATTSRYNKICTLQSELNAGREDCKVLTEDVVTIKNHLDRSNISMDLDESIGDNNIHSAQTKCFMPDIPEEHNIDIYKIDRMDCLNYYIDKTGAQSVPHNVKMVEVMKMLYEYLITKHNNEVENLNNKLVNYENIKHQLQYNIEKHNDMFKGFKEKAKNYSMIDAVLTKIKNNITIVSKELTQDHKIDNIAIIFKETLSLMDSELNVSSVKIFDYIVENILNKHQANLSNVMAQNSELQKRLGQVAEELSITNNNLSMMKNLLDDKEKEYNLLKAKKENVDEITKAVTLDIVRREKELVNTVHKGYESLIQLDILTPERIDLNLPLGANIVNLFELLANLNKSHQNNTQEKAVLSLELENLKSRFKEKDEEINVIKSCYEKLQADNKDVTLNLVCKETKIKELDTSYASLNKMYEEKVEENKANVFTVERLSKEVNMLKSDLIEKENNINSLEKQILNNKKDIEQVSELLMKVKGLQEENANLKSLNDMINKQKECYAEELQKSGETIKKNNIDLDKMTSDILLLRQSVKENSVVIENLTVEAKTLLDQNNELKEQLQIKSKECSRLETNIKTHEKTAQIQTRIITRLEKERKEEDKILGETKEKLQHLTEKCFTLEKQIEVFRLEADQNKKNNEVLQARVAELETTVECYKSRLSVDVSDSSRRRRQSLQDSMRILAEGKHDSGNRSGFEAIFAAGAKPDDMLMDVDDVSSSRSTPIRLSRGRDSLSMSRTEASDKDEEQHSRPSSVRDTRRRRQTTHDSHRSDLSQTSNTQGDTESTVSQLREQLASCQQELEELKEKYRELDLECETCAEYYRERDERCCQLLSENKALKINIDKLEDQLKSDSSTKSSRRRVANVAVNTDEDWTKLHSLVVDRMSFDAEVEKNKKLTKLIEELRFKKQDLKNTIAKMQKALEKYNGNRELEATKAELRACKEELGACKQELVQLKKKYKELDEECDTCAQYLREREEQCLKLKEAKNALEVKLHELQSDTKLLNLSVRKKRQSAHDQNRTPTLEGADVSTQTTEDLLSYQIERDGSSHKEAREVKHLKLAVERLIKQKESLEEQLKATVQTPPSAMYVATGSAIVQNQQITDVMKENQKLKKMNAKLINICKKRGKENDGNRENEKTTE